MKKIAIIGGPSSGKTTAALSLVAFLKMMGYETHFVLEYATNYIIRNGNPKTVSEQSFIFHGQKDEEEYVEKHNKRKKGGIDYLVCDCASFLACVYARHYEPKPNASREKIQKYRFALKTLDKWARERTSASYDYIFFLPSEIPFKKNKIRWQKNREEAKAIGEEIESYLKIEKLNYHIIAGSLMERTGKIMKILFPSKKWDKEKILEIWDLRRK